MVVGQQSLPLICDDGAIQPYPNPNKIDYYAYDGCGHIVDALAAFMRFRVELDHLEGPLQLCERW
ncbi:hypothetical protein E2L06_18535 [Haloterrigena sp. H1]|nr:hypothetical protein E2L06_18535 [Haloterrigena sp. H1]